ncbi:DUF5658 family protein [Methanolobus halotolerans]|uniref:DUF5658 domain-containing protein n=1 Tax=Methanolobus halotolerans TaxID=2052935 RepID=A0A4E0Q526_9EURY|nr:DUF5658 family protein [Methanolobus halotolerans]TGC09145.1 hypothetical protein CUN85_07175 [Methanolobus halotolerans]
MGSIPGPDRDLYSLGASQKDSDLKEFIHDVRYIFVFYVMGDILTTVFALENGLGYEANFLIAELLEYCGYYSIVMLKLFFLCFCFVDYLYLKKRGHRSMWNGTRHMISLLGILVVINNLLVISGAWNHLYSFFYGT